MSDLKLLKELNDLSAKDCPRSSKANSVIYLHPFTMKSLNVFKDSWVFVNSDEELLALKCWPCDMLQTFNTSLHSTILYNYTNCFITITPLTNLFGIAEKLFLYPEKFNPFMMSNDFKTFLEKELSQLCLREELKLHVQYLGYPCYFTVKTVVVNIPKMLGNSLENLTGDSFIDKIKVSQTSTPISSPKFPSKSSHQKFDLKEKTISQHFFLKPSSKIIILKNKYDTHEKITFEDIVGLDKNINFIKSAITAILQPSTGYRFHFPRGIALVGPPGSGKSMIFKILENEYNLHLHFIDLQDFKSFENEGEKTVNEVFIKAHNSSPSIVFLDNMDQVFMRKNSFNHSLKEEKFIRNLVNLIYNTLNSTSDVLVIAVARNENLLQSYIRKDNIFTKELQFSVSSAGRKKILMKILQNFKHLLSEADINKMTDMTNGFCSKELFQLCEKAKELMSNKCFNKTTDDFLTLNDMEKIVIQMKPNIPINFEIPNVKWCDIGGMENIKRAMIKMIEWPLTRAHLFKRFKIPAPRGILLYGPPGCCKTMIAQALVNESKLNFISVKASELFNKYVGESEKSVSELFKKARSSAPCVLFFDEVDSLTSTRGSSSGNSNVCDRILTQLLIEIDGISTLEGVCILAATNRPDIIDPSFLRPGRFDERIYVGLPDYETREKIFEVKLRRLPISSDIDISYLIHSTDGYSGAEIASICQEASKYALREHIISSSSQITMKHFMEALQKVTPQVTDEMKQFFKLYEERQNFKENSL